MFSRLGTFNRILVMRIVREFIETNFLEELYEDVTLVCEKLRYSEFEFEDFNSDPQAIGECYDEIRTTLLKLKALSNQLKANLL